MRILVISAHFPPEHYGGYELRIKDIVDGLVKRGHDIRVLTTRKTSSKGKSAERNHYPILRKLHNRRNARFFPKEVFFDLLDTRFLEKQIKSFNPDVIYLGHIYNLSKAILPYLAEQNIPIVVDEGGASMKGAWTERGRWFRFTGDYRNRFEILNKIKPLVINLVCKLSKDRIKKNWAWPENLHVIVNNEQNFNNIKSLGIPYRDATVIHSGIDINKFAFTPRTQINQPVQIIYPARVEPLKGQVDAVKLVALLKHAGIESHLHLVGPVFSDDYLQQIEDEISANNIDNQVSLVSMVKQEELVSFLNRSDVLFFPTYHQMGFSRTPLEAMACGCVIISYGNEGSDEVIRHEETGFLVEAGNFSEIQNIIFKLIEEPGWLELITSNALRDIETNYALNDYVTKILDYLMAVNRKITAET